MVILSIILPVYNVEQYIQRCINSIYTGVTVNLDNFEVIFVNDASPDKSREIIENAQMYYRNIILINKKTGKPGDAAAIRELELLLENISYLLILMIHLNLTLSIILYPYWRMRR